MDIEATNGGRETSALQTFVERAEQWRVSSVFAVAYTTQVAYLTLAENHPVTASLLHPLLNPLNLSVVSPDYMGHGAIGYTAAIAGGIVYVAAGAGAASALAKSFEKDAQFKSGDGAIGNGFLWLNRLRFLGNFDKWKNTVGIPSPIILAEEEGAIPVFRDLISDLTKNGEKPKNIVMFKSGSDVSLQQGEEIFDHQWVASRGSEPFIDTERWHRTGAFDAKIIVLNAADMSSVDEAVAVVRDQLGNEKTKFFAVINSPTDIPDGATKSGFLEVKEMNALVTSPYLSVARELIESVLNPSKENLDGLIPVADPSIVSKSYLEALQIKRNVLDIKIADISEKLKLEQRKLRISLKGSVQEGEGLGLKNAFEKFGEMCEVVESDSDITLIFGSGEVTDDGSALSDAKNLTIESRNASLILGVVFRRNDMDNMIRHTDAVLSFEASMTKILDKELHSLVEFKIGLWQRLTKLIRRSKKIKRKIITS